MVVFALLMKFRSINASAVETVKGLGCLPTASSSVRFPGRRCEQQVCGLAHKPSSDRSAHISVVETQVLGRWGTVMFDDSVDKQRFMASLCLILETSLSQSWREEKEEFPVPNMPALHRWGREAGQFLPS